MSEKIDLKKQLKPLYSPSAKKMARVEVPAFRFLMVDGRGDPNTSPEYVEAVEALFSVSYTAKFAVKKGPTAVDYAVMPLEGLWWAKDLSVFTSGDRSGWQWTMMMHQPEFATDEVIASAMESVQEKKGLPGVARLRLETFEEGACAQVLHVGPFSEEGPTIERLHGFIDDEQAVKRGKHHEIYLSDIRRAAPAKWRTILRQPMG